MFNRQWLQRASYALQLLQLAFRLSSGPMRLYLTDPSADNFAVGDDGSLYLVDGEGVILVDSTQSSLCKLRTEKFGKLLDKWHVTLN